MYSKESNLFSQHTTLLLRSTRLSLGPADVPARAPCAAPHAPSPSPSYLSHPPGQQEVEEREAVQAHQQAVLSGRVASASGAGR